MDALNSLFSMIHDYLLIALPKEQKCSKNAIRSYRKSLELLLDFAKEKRRKALVDLTFEDIDRNMIADFLEHLEIDRKCSISTRNQRLHFIRSFYKYATQEDITVVQYLTEIQKVKKARQERTLIEHMSEIAVKTIISQPDTTTSIGKRDAFLLLFLYRTGIRVQEMVDIQVSDI